MPDSKTPTYIDPMAEMIAQIRQEERNSAKIDFVVAMFRGNEPDEKIAKYTRMDIEKVREARAVWEDMIKSESERKSRAMVFRYDQIKDFPLTTDPKKIKKRIEGMEISNDKKRNFLQMLGVDPGTRADQ